MSDAEALSELVKQATKAAQERRLDEAAELIESILEQDPDHLRALDLFGFVRFFQGRFAEAETYCHRALELEPDHAYAHKGLGLCLAKQGRLEEGKASLEQAIALKPTWPDPYWDLAVVLTEAERYDDALKVLARGQVSAPARRGGFQQFSAQIRKKKADSL